MLGITDARTCGKDEIIGMVKDGRTFIVNIGLLEEICGHKLIDVIPVINPDNERLNFELPFEDLIQMAQAAKTRFAVSILDSFCINPVIGLIQKYGMEKQVIVIPPGVKCAHSKLKQKRLCLGALLAPGIKNAKESLHRGFRAILIDHSTAESSCGIDKIACIERELGIEVGIIGSIETNPIPPAKIFAESKQETVFIAEN